MEFIKIRGLKLAKNLSCYKKCQASLIEVKNLSVHIFFYALFSTVLFCMQMAYKHSCLHYYWDTKVDDIAYFILCVFFISNLVFKYIRATIC